MMSTRPRLADWLARAIESVPQPSAGQAKLLEQLSRLHERLATERFQLAVLGQFKRGKSTLLNALLREAILPTGVVPVTAIPIFLQHAPELGLRISYNDGRSENETPPTMEELRLRLRQLASEEENPHNVFRVARLDVFLPSPLLEEGVVLIDTPGVGSTHLHNTATADAILPECDATLFVVSSDPPITQVELEYLARIRATVAHLTIVVNKIDTLEPNERKTAVAFLRRVLDEQAGLNGATPLFCVSARTAFRATENGDQVALANSGLPEIEAHLLQFLAHEKRATLAAAIARKAATIVDELRLETEIALKSLRLPMEELAERIRTFDAAAIRFEQQRQSASDLLAGDRARALQELEADAARLLREGHEELAREAASTNLASRVAAFFDSALAEVVQTTGDRLAEIFRAHQQRADELIALVRQTAADLLEIPFVAPSGSEKFEAKRDPYWITTTQPVALSPIPAAAFDRFLPQAMREQRQRQRYLDELDAVLRRNVENLRWATRQNLEDAFRRFAAELDNRLALSLEATRGAMQTAFARRSERAEAAETEIAARVASLTDLQEIAAALAELSRNSENESEDENENQKTGVGRG